MPERPIPPPSSSTADPLLASVWRAQLRGGGRETGGKGTTGGCRWGDLVLMIGSFVCLFHCFFFAGRHGGKLILPFGLVPPDEALPF